MKFLIVSSHKYGHSYWNGISFGCKMKSVRYNSRKEAQSTILHDVKPFMLVNNKLGINYPNYGVPYAERIEEE